MADKEAVVQATIADRTILFHYPTDGQLEALIRVSKVIERADDTVSNEFYAKQINRIALLIESLFVSADDLDWVDELMLTGKLGLTGIVRAVFEAIKGDRDDEAEVAEEAATTASKTRVRRR